MNLISSLFFIIGLTHSIVCSGNSSTMASSSPGQPFYIGNDGTNLTAQAIPPINKICFGNGTCFTSAGGSQNLQQVLTVGADAGGLSPFNLGGLMVNTSSQFTDGANYIAQFSMSVDTTSMAGGFVSQYFGNAPGVFLMQAGKGTPSSPLAQTSGSGTILAYGAYDGTGFNPSVVDALISFNSETLGNVDVSPTDHGSGIIMNHTISGTLGSAEAIHVFGSGFIGIGEGSGTTQDSSPYAIGLYGGGTQGTVVTGNMSITNNSAICLGNSLFNYSCLHADPAANNADYYLPISPPGGSPEIMIMDNTGHISTSATAGSDLGTTLATAPGFNNASYYTPQDIVGLFGVVIGDTVSHLSQNQPFYLRPDVSTADQSSLTDVIGVAHQYAWVTKTSEFAAGTQYALQFGDRMLAIFAQGYDQATYNNDAGFICEADGTFSPGPGYNHPTHCSLLGTLSGPQNSYTHFIDWYSDGTISMGPGLSDIGNATVTTFGTQQIRNATDTTHATLNLYPPGSGVQDIWTAWNSTAGSYQVASVSNIGRGFFLAGLYAPSDIEMGNAIDQTQLWIHSWSAATNPIIKVTDEGSDNLLRLFPNRLTVNRPTYIGGDYGDFTTPVQRFGVLYNDTSSNNDLDITSFQLSYGPTGANSNSKNGLDFIFYLNPASTETYTGYYVAVSNVLQVGDVIDSSGVFKGNQMTVAVTGDNADITLGIGQAISASIGNGLLRTGIGQQIDASAGTLGIGGTTENVFSIGLEIAGSNAVGSSTENKAVGIQIDDNINGDAGKTFAIKSLSVEPSTFVGSVNTGGATPATNVALSYNDGHILSTQTTAPSAAVNSNAGTGASCSVSGTDTDASIVLVTTGILSNSGVVCDINFNKAFNLAPKCQLTATNSTAILDSVIQGVYITKATTVLHLNFANTDAIGRTYNWDLHCAETN